MKFKTRKLMALLLGASLVTTAFAPALVSAEETVTAAEQEVKEAAKEFAYDGDSFTFMQSDSKAFGMFAPQDGTAVTLKGNQVHVVFYPKNKTVYAGFYLGADITDSATWREYEAAAEDGNYDFCLPDTYCGYAWPVAPVKKSDLTATTSAQYYMAIPAKDKLASEEEQTESEKQSEQQTESESETQSDTAPALSVSDGTYLLKNMKSSLGMLHFSGPGNAYLTTPTRLVVAGDQATITLITTDSSVKRYSHIYLGKYAETSDTTVGVEGVLSKDGSTRTFTLVLPRSELKEQLYYVLKYGADYEKAEYAGKWYKASKGDYYFTLGTPEKLADYTAVDKAMESIPTDTSKYTEESVKNLTQAVAAVDRNLSDSEQAKVDAMAKAIDDAVKALAKKEAAPAEHKEGDALLSGGDKYVVNKDADTVTYAGPSGKNVKSAKVPGTIKVDGKKYKVTAIANNAFKGNAKLTSVKIGGNVEKIGNSAFANCTALKSVSIPKNVVTIGKNAFAGCKAMTKVTIKSAVLKKIGSKAFSKTGSNHYNKLKVIVPKKQLSAYTKMLKSAKLSSKAVITKK